MKHILTLLNDLRRPAILIRAARIGAQDYRRETLLRRQLGYGKLPRPGEALTRLMDIEQDLESQRQADAAGYSATRHVEVLIAMMGEARILRATHRECVT